MSAAWRSIIRARVRQSTGVPSHRWRLRRRVVQASQGIAPQAGLRLADITLRSGFGDQSHLTRVFSREVCVSPGGVAFQFGR
jgi:AraC family transcriptional regulator